MENEVETIVHPIEGTNIIYSKVTGEVTAEISETLFERTEKIALTFDNPNEINLLIDAYEGGKACSKARKQFTSVLKMDKIKKVAILGNRPFLRAMLSFYRIVSGVNKIRAFSSKDDAIRWLKE